MDRNESVEVLNYLQGDLKDELNLTTAIYAKKNPSFHDFKLVLSGVFSDEVHWRCVDEVSTPPP